MGRTQSIGKNRTGEKCSPAQPSPPVQDFALFRVWQALNLGAQPSPSSFLKHESQQKTGSKLSVKTFRSKRFGQNFRSKRYWHPNPSGVAGPEPWRPAQPSPSSFLKHESPQPSPSSFLKYESQKKIRSKLSDKNFPGTQTLNNFYKL